MEDLKLEEEYIIVEEELLLFKSILSIMYNDNGYIDMFNETEINSDFISVDTIIVNDSLTTPSITFQQASNYSTTVTNANPTVNNEITIPNSGFSSTNFILKDFEGNVGGTTTPQVINSDLQLLGSVTYTVQPQFDLPVNSVLFMGSTNSGTANKPILVSTNLNNGQLLIGSTNNSPAAANLTSTGSTIVITNGSNSINLETASNQTFGNITLTDSSNQLIFKPGNTTPTITLTTTNPAVSRTYTIPDSGANSSLVLTDGNQTINGSKIFSSTLECYDYFQVGDSGRGNLNSTELINIYCPEGGSYFIGVDDTSSNITPVIVDPTATGGSSACNIVLNEGTQTMHGFVEFQNQVQFDNSGNQIILKTSSSATPALTLTLPSLASSQSYTFPDAGGSANFILSQSSSNQTITGNYSSGALAGGLTIVNNNSGYASCFVQGDDSSNIPGQLRVAGKTNPDLQLLCGVCTGSTSYGSIQGYLQGTGSKNLVLQEGGSNVGIATNNPQYILDVNGTINTSSGIYFPTSGGTASLLNYCEEGVSVTIALTGAVFINSTAIFTRIGGKVNMIWEGVNTLIVTADPITAASGSIPSRFCPNRTIEFMVPVINSSGVQNNPGAMIISTDGSINVYLTLSQSNFTASNVGWNTFSVDYSIY